LPALIDELESEQKSIHEELADGSLYGREPERAAQLAQRSAQIEEELLAALERWEALGSTGA
jgi:ATP-binding cassette subfamily F protein uup